jgi:putative nucleotidyltransferase with HDIG domain
VLVSTAILGIAAGGLLALVVALIAGFDRPGLAAALGALGALAASAVGALGVSALRRFSVPTLHEQLVDVASPLHPLMKRLIAEAPGTYVHSVAVANLADAAAEAIGADSLVARVGAYYHDIGKLTQPGFFFENQEDEDSPHVHASPSHSADIIMAHVEDGVAIAKQYGLPAPVVDIIREHHGTSLVRYFYHQAARTDAGVFEADFRYRGAKPRTREAALVMLADGSEASVRAMGHPDARAIEGAVRAVVSERLADGQLVDCGLGNDEIERVVEIYVKRLVSFRHVRCPYPNPAHTTGAGGS